MRILSKSKLLSYRQCSKRLWLEVHRPDLCEASTATKAVFKIGRHVGEIARRLYDPKEQGALVEVQKKGFKAALCRSTKLLSSSKPIIEAGFASGGAIGRSSGSPTQLFYWPYTNKSYPKAAFFRVCGFQKRELERYAVKPRRIAKNAPTTPAAAPMSLPVPNPDQERVDILRDATDSERAYNDDEPCDDEHDGYCHRGLRD